MACIFINEVVFPWHSRGALALTNALRVSCTYTEYFFRPFNIHCCIRSEYAARTLAMRYEYASQYA